MGHGKVSEELNIMMLCKKMRWTYEEIMQQPRWFVESMSGLLSEDAKKENKQSKKIKSK